MVNATAESANAKKITKAVLVSAKFLRMAVVHQTTLFATAEGIAYVTNVHAKGDIRVHTARNAVAALLYA